LSARVVHGKPRPPLFVRVAEPARQGLHVLQKRGSEVVVSASVKTRVHEGRFSGHLTAAMRSRNMDEVDEVGLNISCRRTAPRVQAWGSDE